MTKALEKRNEEIEELKEYIIYIKNQIDILLDDRVDELL